MVLSFLLFLYIYISRKQGEVSFFHTFDIKESLSFPFAELHNKLFCKAYLIEKKIISILLF